MFWNRGPGVATGLPVNVSVTVGTLGGLGPKAASTVKVTTGLRTPWLPRLSTAWTCTGAAPVAE